MKNEQEKLKENAGKSDEMRKRMERTMKEKKARKKERKNKHRRKKERKKKSLVGFMAYQPL